MSDKYSDPKEKFIHRDVSWLAFNERVLAQAQGADPLLERVKFLAIFANNLDEFLMVRVAGVKRLIDANYNRKDDFGFFPQELDEEISLRIADLTERLYATYCALLQELWQNRILIIKSAQLNAEQKKAAKRYFENVLFPIITPMAIDQGHPFPALLSKTTAFGVHLTREDESHLVVLAIPQSVPRLFKLPSDKDQDCFILIDDLIRDNLESFFRGYTIFGSFKFRLVRDAELAVKEDFASDLLKAIESEIKKRPKARVVSLQVERDALPQSLQLLCDGLDFKKDKVLPVDDELDLTYLFELLRQVTRPDLCYRGYIPAKLDYESIFEKVKEGDFILCLPYQSFQPTVDLIQQASRDPDVLAIKMILYRTDEDSAIVKSLIEAAKSKKQVTVLVELKARFDEERNIDWTRDLESAGCHVIYGVSGMKTHSKIALVVRKEEGRIVRYVHLSTGNYNERTAKVYTDIGYFTANDDFAKDISDFFNVITGYSLPGRWKSIIASPNDLRQYFFELIDKEIGFQKKYRNGLIFAKMNSLEDVRMIEKLYEASREGVRIKLIVRGICCLVPGVEGMSENIEVKSIVGRFLEHSRIYLFNNNYDPRIYLASADWMSRNFDRRIELMFGIGRDELKRELKEIMDECWKDDLKSWSLGSDRRYARSKADEKGYNVQESLIKRYTE